MTTFFAPFTRRAAACALLLAGTQAFATDYIFNPTSGTVSWSTTTIWTPNGTPGAGDNIDATLIGSSGATLALGGTTRTINNLTKTVTNRWNIVGNSSSLSMLNVSTITSGTLNMNFYDNTGGGGLNVNAGNITVTGGSTQFGLNASGATNALHGLSVSGTTSVSGGELRVNILNATSSYSLGLLTVSSTGIVSLNNAPSGKADSTGNVTGLNGTGGFIQTTATTAGVGGHNGNASTLAITNTADFSSSTVLRDGLATTLGATLLVTKAGAGTQALTGANSYTGLTSITNGTLKLGNASALGGRAGIVATNTDNGTRVSGTGTLDLGGQTGITEVIRLNGTGFGGNGALINSSGNAASISSGIADIVQTASGTVATNLTLSGGGGTGATATLSMGVTNASFTINGGTTVYSVAPTVSITGGTTNATATANLTNGIVTSITLNNIGAGYTTAPTITFSGGTVTAAGTNPTGTGNASNYTTVGYTISASGSGYTSAPTIAFSSGTFAATAKVAGIVLEGDSTIGGSGDITINGIVSESGGSHALTKIGTSVLTLANTGNSYTGGTVINAGSISIATDSALGTAPAAATAGQLVINGGALTTTAGFTLNANRGIDLGTTGGQINATTGTLSYGGVIAGSAGLQKSGAGTLALSGVNTYGGATFISGGTLSISADSALGAAPTSATLAQLTFDGGTLATTADLTLNSTRGVSLGASGGTIDVGTGTAVTYGGSVAGAGSLAKTGTGTLNFTAASSYSGATTVIAGTLGISNDAALGTGAGGVSVASGATLALSGDITVAGEALSLNGDGTATNAGALRNVSGANTWTGNLAIAAGNTRINSDAGSLLISGNISTAGTGNFNIGGNADIEVSGVVSGTLALFKSSVGGGTLTLSNPGNSYTGITTIAAGTVKISSEGNLGATPGTVVSNSLRIRGGVLQTTATLSLSATRGVLLSNGGGGVSVDAGTSLTVNGVIAGSSTDTLEKSGAGALALTAANTYSGGSTITGGTVYVNNTSGSGLGTGDVTVDVVAALGGSGSVILGADKSVTVNGSLVVGNPGDTTGSSLALTTSGAGSTILGGTSTLHLGIFGGAGLGDSTGNAFAADILDLSGNLTITLGAVLKLENPNGIASGTWADGDTFKLFDWSGLVSRNGTFSIDASDLNLPANLMLNTADLYTLGNISFAAVPEPGRVSFMAAALACLMLRRRR
ncbi:beta strand repeat-containing protein [Prosthecobacter sp.]|uniref:beta strand repeat-containing protein n=1 Tax=Prosthecobacter sp. TaxID=1965333 RepID=UPI003782E684